MGTLEILLIIVIAFCVLGPKQLPQVAKKCAEIINAVKKITTMVKEDLHKEIVLEENKQRALDADLKYKKEKEIH